MEALPARAAVSWRADEVVEGAQALAGPLTLPGRRCGTHTLPLLPRPLGDHCPTILGDREPGKGLLHLPPPALALACSSDVGLCVRAR